jgi:hypothetical protein
MVVTKKVQLSQMDSKWHSISTGRAQKPLPSMRRCISARSLRISELVRGRQLRWLVVKGFDLLGDGEVFLGNGLVRYPGVDRGHGKGLVAKERGDGVQAHAAVDGLGGQGCTCR